jgi:hypothetical protein
MFEKHFGGLVNENLTYPLILVHVLVKPDVRETSNVAVYLTLAPEVFRQPCTQPRYITSLTQRDVFIIPYIIANMSDTVFEIATLPLRADANLKSNEDKQAWNDTLTTIAKQHGCKTIYWGLKIEDPTTLIMAIRMSFPCPLSPL